MPIGVGTPGRLRNTATLELDKKRGMVGSKIYYCNNTDVYPYSADLPMIGDIFNVGFENLTCQNIKVKEVEAWQCEVTATYSTDGNYIENFMERSMDFSVEAMTINKGMRWEDSGTPVDIPVSIHKPNCDYAIAVKLQTTPLDKIWTTQGKLNKYIFHGAPVGQLLYLGGSFRECYNSFGQTMESQIVHKFSRRDRDWNDVWAEPKQLMVDSVPQFYQNRDASLPNYNAIKALDSTPVWTDDMDGHGRWTKPFYIDDEFTATSGYENYTTSGNPDYPGYDGTASLSGGVRYNFDYADFAAELNLYKFEGDGGAGTNYPITGGGSWNVWLGNTALTGGL